MTRSAAVSPVTDPTPIFESFRGNHATELLTAAVAHLGIFRELAAGPLPADGLRRAAALEERPFLVLTTALKAMGLLAEDAGGLVVLSGMAREHLIAGSDFDVSGYVGLAAERPVFWRWSRG